MRVVALGRTRFLLRSIEAVAAAGHTIAGILTADASPHYEVGPADFEALAGRLGARFRCDARAGADETHAWLDGLGAEIGISVNWPTLLRARTLGIPSHGILNAHFGALPRYRGNAVPNWAILNGEREIAVTIHAMTEALDAGAIYAQQPVPITEDTYIGPLYDSIAATLPSMFAAVLDGIASDTLTPAPQSTDPADALRCYPRRPEDGWIDWTQPAAAIHRLIRASAEPLAGAYTCVEGRRLTVWRARPADPPEPFAGVPGQVAARDTARGEATVLTGDGMLALETVQLEGGPRTPAAEVLTSLRQRVGLTPGALAEALLRFRPPPP